MKNTSRFLLAAATLALPALSATHAGSAAACMNEVAYEASPAIKAITASEVLLGAGKEAQAVAGLAKIFPGLRVDPRLPGLPTAGIDKTASRAARLVAVAVVRTEGLLDLGEAFPSATARDRRANVEWAIGILRAFARVGDGPAVQTDLGEALSKLPETRTEALGILDGLARKDLMTSPQGYGALAELRRAAGDQAGAEEARKKFERMAPAAGRGKGNG